MKPAVFFTSDTHFDHTNIIRVSYSNRPFKKPDGEPDGRLMNETLVRNWNETVRPDDIVYHLGDFGFGSTARQAHWAKQLHGRKTLVRGNHDRLTLTGYKNMGFERVEKRLKLGRLYLVHWPPIDAAPPDGCEFVLCGHVHERWMMRGLCINVGVDVRDFRPVTLRDLDLDPKLMEER